MTMMKLLLVSLLAFVAPLAQALAPRAPPTKTTTTLPPFVAYVQKASASVFAAATIAAVSAFGPTPDVAQAADPLYFQNAAPTVMVSEKVIREGIYREYEVEVPDQVYDDARSTFKTAKETKSKKGKYTALLAILIVGSFVIPMAQYFWYVRDDDSTEQFFGQTQKVEEPPPKKKGWF